MPSTSLDRMTSSAVCVGFMVISQPRVVACTNLGRVVFLP